MREVAEKWFTMKRRQSGLQGMSAMWLSLYWLAVLALVGAALYYGSMLGGWLKEPIMAHLRHYGGERAVRPLLRFLVALGTLYLVLFPVLASALTGAGVVALLLLTALVSLGVGWSPWRQALPRWYARMLDETTYEERRAIAFAWFRLPFRTRLRLSGDTRAFGIFLDEVRLTIIYGARDRDDPWTVYH